MTCSGGAVWGGMGGHLGRAWTWQGRGLGNTGAGGLQREGEQSGDYAEKRECACARRRPSAGACVEELALPKSVESDNRRLNKVVIRSTSDYRAGLRDLDAAADARQRAACLLACSPHHPTPCALRGRRARIIRRLGRQAKFGFDFGDACPKRGVLRNQSVDPPISATINASFSGESVSGKTVIAKFDDGLLSLGRRHSAVARGRATLSRRRSARRLHGGSVRARVDHPHARRGCCARKTRQADKTRRTATDREPF